MSSHSPQVREKQRAVLEAALKKQLRAESMDVKLWTNCGGICSEILWFHIQPTSKEG